MKCIHLDWSLDWKNWMMWNLCSFSWIQLRFRDCVGCLLKFWKGKWHVVFNLHSNRSIRLPSFLPISTWHPKRSWEVVLNSSKKIDLQAIILSFHQWLWPNMCSVPVQVVLGIRISEKQFRHLFSGIKLFPNNSSISLALTSTWGIMKSY